MRFPGNKIYRAFPELDRFSDEQCSRFLKAAKRDWWFARLVRALLPWIIGVIASIAGLAGLAWLGTLIPGSNRLSNSNSQWALIVTLLIGLTPVLLGMLIGLIARDILLRRRLRSVINERGKCLKCGYLLLGLNVTADLKVTCPECGEVTEVDSSLDELAQTPSGTQFQPKTHVTAIGISPQERRRRRRILIYTLSPLFLIILTPLGIWGWFELTVELDARQAAADRPRAAGINAFAAKYELTGPTDDDTTAWAILNRVRAKIDQVDALVWNKPDGPVNAQGRAVYPEFGLVSENNPPEDAEALDNYQASKALAAQLITKYDEAGGFTELAKLQSCTRFTQPLQMTSLGALTFPYGTAAEQRLLAKILFDRLNTAIIQNQPAQFDAGLRSLFMLSRFVRHQPSVMAGMIAAIAETLAFDAMSRGLATHKSAEWINAVSGPLHGRVEDVSRIYAFESERLLLLERTSGVSSSSRLMSARVGPIGSKAASAAAEVQTTTTPGQRTATSSTSASLNFSPSSPQTRTPAPRPSLFRQPRPSHAACTWATWNTPSEPPIATKPTCAAYKPCSLSNSSVSQTASTPRPSPNSSPVSSPLFPSTPGPANPTATAASTPRPANASTSSTPPEPMASTTTEPSPPGAVTTPSSSRALAPISSSTTSGDNTPAPSINSLNSEKP